MTLLILSFLTTARLRLQAAYNVAGAAKADLIAEAAINLTMMQILSEQDTGLRSAQGAIGAGRVAAAAAGGAPDRPLHDGRPRSCLLDGAAIVITVEDEAGKIDLNAASAKLIKAALTGFGVEQQAADALANAIVDFRAATNAGVAQPAPDYASAGRPFGSKHALFQSVFELDQVAGFDPTLFRQTFRYFTVHSRHPGVDSRQAPPALFAALSGASPADVQSLMVSPFPNNLDREDPRFPAAFKQQGGGRVLLMRAEALLPTGHSAVREEIIDLNDAGSAEAQPQYNPSPFAVKEIRHGRGIFFPQLRAAISSRDLDWPPC